MSIVSCEGIMNSDNCNAGNLPAPSDLLEVLTSEFLRNLKDIVEDSNTPSMLQETLINLVINNNMVLKINNLEE